MVTLVRPHTTSEIETGFPAGFSSVADIGARRNGRIVRADHFLAYERVMVAAITSFLCVGSRQPHAGRIEADKTSLRDSRRLEDRHGFDRVMMKSLPSRGAELSVLDAQDVARLALRECLWFELASSQRSVHFGYDLYVYFAGAQLADSMKEAFRHMGMWVGSIRALPAGYREL